MRCAGLVIPAAITLIAVGLALPLGERSGRASPRRSARYLGPAFEAAAATGAPRRRVRGTLVISDLEGHGERLRDAIRGGKLRLIDGRLDFVYPADAREKLLFNGDLPGLGPETLTLVGLLGDFKRRYPDRVTINWGNHDLKFLGLMPELRRLEKTTRWLENALSTEGTPIPADRMAKRALLKRHNTLVRRLQHWLADHSAKGSLELHQQQLAKRTRGPVTLERAAADFVRQMKPGGRFFTFLEQGQVMKIDGPTLHCHGGVSERNMGWVPGAMERSPGPRQWERDVNRQTAQELSGVKAALRRGRTPSLALRDYGECEWDSTAQTREGDKGVAFPRATSPIYHRVRGPDGLNFRLSREKVRRWLGQDAITTVDNAHSPAGDVPVPLVLPGYLEVKGDTSKGEGHSTMQIDPRGNLWVEGMTRSGAPITYRLSPEGSRFVGNVTEDGYNIIGRGRVDGRTMYVLTKYYEGFTIDEQHLTREELEQRGVRPPTSDSHVDVADRDILVRSLQAKKKNIWSMDQVATKLLANKVPVVVSGAAGAADYGNYPAAPGVVHRVMRELATMLDPTRAGSPTGGADCGIEKVYHQAARREGITVVGFLQEGAIPGEVKTVKDVAIVAGANQWLDPLLAAENLAREMGGLVIFVGGGEAVAKGIKAAQASGTPYYVMRKDPSWRGSGGASGVAAAEHPDRSFGSASELAALLRRDGFEAVLRRGR